MRLSAACSTCSTRTTSTVTTPAPDAPDWTEGQSAVVAPQFLGTFTLLPGQSSPVIDITSYATVRIGRHAGGVADLGVIQSFQGMGVTDNIQATADTLATSETLPVLGNRLVMTNLDGAITITVGVWGSSQSPRLVAPSFVGAASRPWVGNIASHVFAAGDQVALVPAANVKLFQGPAFMYFDISGLTVEGFVFTFDANPGGIRLCDTKQTFVASTGDRVFYGMVALPSTVGTIAFQAATPGTAAIEVRLVPAWV